MEISGVSCVCQHDPIAIDANELSADLSRRSVHADGQGWNGVGRGSPQGIAPDLDDDSRAWGRALIFAARAKNKREGKRDKRQKPFHSVTVSEGFSLSRLLFQMGITLTRGEIYANKFAY